MKLYMHWGEAWDLMFRSFLVFIFFGLLWLKYIDATIPCLFGFPVPILLGVAYFYWGWRKAKNAWLEEQAQEDESNVEAISEAVSKNNVETASSTIVREV